jgi:hypothetical protein
MGRTPGRRTWLFHSAFYGMINGCRKYVSRKDFRYILGHNEAQCQISYHSRHFKRSIITNSVNHSPYILSDFLKKDFKINGSTPLLRFVKINNLFPWEYMAHAVVSLFCFWAKNLSHSDWSSASIIFVSDLCKRTNVRELALHFPLQ